MKQDNEITLRPSSLFAFLKVLPLMLTALALLLLEHTTTPLFLLPALVLAGFSAYRFFYIRACRYLITPEIIRLRRGIFFKRVDQVEMYRIKDYIITQTLLLQVFRLMDVTLKTTDPENPIVWFRGIPATDLVDTIRGHVQEARKHNQIVELN